MAIWDKVRQGIDKAGKAAQDVFDEGKLRLDAYRAREQADKAAEALGYAIFRAADAGGELEAEARQRLLDALRARDSEARKLETDLANERAAAGAAAPAAATEGASSTPGTPPATPASDPTTPPA
ncbi:hypothetical protein [Gemmatimonas sp.]|jgi:hypothetical protein|uniref:hypothetical protein n=1 Tax=Gemmatimonas sp. TaxID=1962908 RepID=UPI0037C088A8